MEASLQGESPFCEEQPFIYLRNKKDAVSVRKFILGPIFFLAFLLSFGRTPNSYLGQHLTDRRI